MKATIPNYYATVERLKARAAELEAEVVAALGHVHDCDHCKHDAKRTYELVAARLLLAAQGLVKALDAVSINVCTSQVDLGEPPARKPRRSLEEVLALKELILQASGAINFYGPDALRRSQPQYFDLLVPLTDGLLDSAADASAGQLAKCAEGSTSAHELSYKAHYIVRLLTTRIKRARGGRRGRLTLAISLLDDAENIARACTLANPPREQDADRQMSALERALKAADASMLNSEAVRDATTAVLMPLARQLNKLARDVCPEIAEAEKEGIAFLD